LELRSLALWRILQIVIFSTTIIDTIQFPICLPVKNFIKDTANIVQSAGCLIHNQDHSFDFVKAFWNEKPVPYEDGYLDPYYDGILYLFGLMHLSGRYQLIKPR
jgi:hypothetical protein